MRLSREHLRTALAWAIEAREEYEREKLGYVSDSGIVAGWRETLAALERGSSARNEGDCMTGYHVRLGYMGYSAKWGNDAAGAWEALKQEARKIADDPPAIIAEARRLGAPETCRNGCCQLDSYADNYAGPFGKNGHPVKLLEPDHTGENQLMQLAATDHAIKYHVRRAFIRLLIEACHRQEIEVCLSVV